MPPGSGLLAPSPIPEETEAVSIITVRCHDDCPQTRNHNDRLSTERV
jgi:hypothetical protein